MIKEVVAASTTMLVGVVAMATTTMDTEETMAGTEVAEAEEMEAITTALATMDMVVVMAMAHHLLPAVSRTFHLVLLHKLLHTLAEMAVAVFLHRHLQAGCLVWLSLLLLSIKAVIVAATITMAVATTTEEATEVAATMVAETTMAADIAAVEEEEVVVVAEVDMTDIRSLLLGPPSGGRTLLTRYGSGSHQDSSA
jgi:hypothetical protein